MEGGEAEVGGFHQGEGVGGEEGLEEDDEGYSKEVNEGNEEGEVVDEAVDASVGGILAEGVGDEDSGDQGERGDDGGEKPAPGVFGLVAVFAGEGLDEEGHKEDAGGDEPGKGEVLAGTGGVEFRCHGCSPFQMFDLMR